MLWKHVCVPPRSSMDGVLCVEDHETRAEYTTSRTDMRDCPPSLHYTHAVFSGRFSFIAAECQDVHNRHTGPAPCASYLALTT